MELTIAIQNFHESHQVIFVSPHNATTYLIFTQPHKYAEYILTPVSW